MNLEKLIEQLDTVPTDQLPELFANVVQEYHGRSNSGGMIRLCEALHELDEEAFVELQETIVDVVPNS